MSLGFLAWAFRLDRKQVLQMKDKKTSWSPLKKWFAGLVTVAAVALIYVGVPIIGENWNRDQERARSFNSSHAMYSRTDEQIYVTIGPFPPKYQIRPPGKFATPGHAQVEFGESLDFELPLSRNSSYSEVTITLNGSEMSVGKLNSKIWLQGRDLEIAPPSSYWQPRRHELAVAIGGIDEDGDEPFRAEWTGAFYCSWIIDYGRKDSALFGSLNRTNVLGNVYHDVSEGCLKLVPDEPARPLMTSVVSRDVGEGGCDLAIFLEYSIETARRGGPLVLLPSNTTAQIADGDFDLVTVKQGYHYLASDGTSVGRTLRSKAARLRSPLVDARKERRSVWIVRSAGTLTIWTGHESPELLGTVMLSGGYEMTQRKIGVRSAGSVIRLYKVEVFGQGSRPLLPPGVSEAMVDPA